MSRTLWVGIVVTLVSLGAVAAVVGVGLVTAGEGPLADAGLDQEVPEGTTVYLDAGGSRAPDGELVGYNWTVTRPDGTSTTPDCSDCEQTSFRPERVGTYTVTLTITDGEGRTDTDTLYVEVSEHEPPTVSLTGPATLDVGDTAAFTMTATEGDARLSSYRWLFGGTIHDDGFFDGETGQTTNLTFDKPGSIPVTATVVDTAGFQARTTTNVTVRTTEPYVAVTITNTTSPVDARRPLLVNATVHNVGREAITDDIQLKAGDGQTLAVAENVSLAADESKSVSLRWETGSDDAGRHRLTVASTNDTATTGVRVEEQTGHYFAVTIDRVLHNVTGGNPLPFQRGSAATADWPEIAIVQVNVTNIGTETGTQQITLDGENTSGRYTDLDNTMLTLEPGESREIDLNWYDIVQPPENESLTAFARSANETDSETFYERETDDSCDEDDGEDCGGGGDGIPKELSDLYLVVPDEVEPDSSHGVDAYVEHANTGDRKNIDTTAHQMPWSEGPVDVRNGRLQGSDGKIIVEDTAAAGDEITVCISLQEAVGTVNIRNGEAFGWEAMWTCETADVVEEDDGGGCDDCGGPTSNRAEENSRATANAASTNQGQTVG